MKRLLFLLDFLAWNIFFISWFILSNQDLIIHADLIQEKESLEHLIHRRHHILHDLALTGLSDEFFRPPHCPINRITIPDPTSFGQTGNIVITLVHALWLGRKVNATVVAPFWMEQIFMPFNTSFFHSLYCVTSDQTIPKGGKEISVPVSDAFYGFALKQYLPEVANYHFTQDWPLSYKSPLIQELSRHFLQVYAALWSSPIEEILDLAIIVIRTFFGQSLGYTAIHKRSFEGTCNRVFHTHLEYFPNEIPLDHFEWKQNSQRGNHPFCTLSPSFVAATFQLNRRSPSLANTFIAFDGQSDISAFYKQGSVTTTIFYEMAMKLKGGLPIDPTILSHYPHIDLSYLRQLIEKKPQYLSSKYWKYVDMLLLMHAEFSLLNPHSTFSFQAFVVRIAFGLQSVPFIRGNDIFLHTEETRKKEDRNLWISPLSLLEASVTLKIATS